MIERVRVPRDCSVREELMRRRSRPVGYLVAAAAMVPQTLPLVLLLPARQAVLVEPLLAVAADAVLEASD